jgi:site-specific recombinase XerD
MLMQAVESYLELRRALGFSLRSDGDRLKSFARHASARGQSLIIAQTAIEWAGSIASLEERARRLRAVVGFARFAHAEDVRHEVPADDVFQRTQQRRPAYIFAPQDIARLVASARRIEPKGSPRSLGLSVLFALLAATGLRIREALKLRLSDVTCDGLVIRETKFRKSRLVPLHPTAAAGLGRYLDQRQVLATQDDHVFLNRHGRPLSCESARDAFRQLVGLLGLLPGDSGQPRPRLHSLRHYPERRIIPRRPWCGVECVVNRGGI